MRSRSVSVTKDAEGVFKMADRGHLRRASAAVADSFVACALYKDSSDDEEAERSTFESSKSKEPVSRSIAFS